MSHGNRPRSLALVTGASTGIGYGLAQCCAEAGFDLLVAADEPAIERAAEELRAWGVSVKAVQVDLATPEGVEHLHRVAEGPVVSITPTTVLAEMHRRWSEPGSGERSEPIRRKTEEEIPWPLKSKNN